MGKEKLLLTAWCKACGTTVGHNMSCACPSSSYLNQDAQVAPGFQIKNPDIAWAEETLGYSH